MDEREVIRQRTVHRTISIGELKFEAMGEEGLIKVSDKCMVELSRSLSREEVDRCLMEVLDRVEDGAVVYTGAISYGEKIIAKAVRTAGFPLVIMLFDGFPAAGSNLARHFTPGGVYHQACQEGRLLLMVPSEDNYNIDGIISLTDKELECKAIKKSIVYNPIPHASKRWRYVAGNMMLRIISSL